MGAASSASIIRVPGALKWNGTEIGTCRDKEFIPSMQVRAVFAEEWGCASNFLYVGEACVFKAVLRYPDSSAMGMLPAGSMKYVANGLMRAGMSLTAGTLLFTPRASQHPSITIHNAHVAYDDSARLQLSLGEEYGFALVWYGTPDSSGKVYTVA